MKLTRPLIFFDCETTGTSVAKDRIVSIACKKVNPDNTVDKRYMLINPEMPIPKGASKVHGITDAMVADAPKFRQVAKGMAAFFDDADVCGFNSNQFDILLLAEEFIRAGVTSWPAADMKSIDSHLIFKFKEKRDLTSAVMFYAGEAMIDAHSADADVEATHKVLSRQLDRYDDLGAMTVDELHTFCLGDEPKRYLDLAGKIYLNEDNEPCYTGGKWKDCKVKDQLSYCSWMIGETDGTYTSQTKSVLRKLVSMYNKKPDDDSQIAQAWFDDVVGNYGRDNG